MPGDSPTIAYPWWQPAGARVLAISPYCGSFKNFFTHYVDIEAPRTCAGYMTVPVKTLADPDWFSPREPLSREDADHV